VGDGAPEAETRLFVAVDDAHLEPGGALNRGDEVRCVARITDRARGNGVDALRAELPRERRHALDRLDRRAHRRIGDHAAFRQPRREPWGRLHFVDDLDGAFG